jgi:hypothetical protein
MTSSGIRPNGSCRKLKVRRRKFPTPFEQRPQVSPVFDACTWRTLVVGNYGAVTTKPKSAVTFYVNGVARFAQRTNRTARQEPFRCRGLVSPTGSPKMKQMLGLSIALLLFGSGVWANVGSGSLSQNRDAWVSHAIR